MQVITSERKKAVVLLSGGIDSTTCLAMAVQQHGPENVLALTLHYGQKHARELGSAAAVTAYYGVRHKIKDLRGVFGFSNSPLLANSTQEIPEGSYADTNTREVDGMSKTYVPFRNGLLLSYAAAVAYSEGARYIYYGAHADDATGNAYPDCSKTFYEAMGDAIYWGTGNKVFLEAPLIDKNKKQVVEIGLDLGAPYHLTWSCYKGQKRACGKCATCRDRIAAFELNGVKDPIAYAE